MSQIGNSEESNKSLNLIPGIMKYIEPRNKKYGETCNDRNVKIYR